MVDKNSIFSEFPGKDILLDWYKKQVKKRVPGINGHIHTPHSVLLKI